jgi:antitoxin CptB
MLELDLILEPFYLAHQNAFSRQEQELFEKLLTHSDPSLYSWLMEKDQPGEDDLNDMVQRIVTYHRASKR